MWLLGLRIFAIYSSIFFEIILGKLRFLGAFFEPVTFGVKVWKNFASILYIWIHIIKYNKDNTYLKSRDWFLYDW